MGMGMGNREHILRVWSLYFASPTTGDRRQAQVENQNNNNLWIIYIHFM